MATSNTEAAYVVPIFDLNSAISTDDIVATEPVTPALSVRETKPDLGGPRHDPTEKKQRGSIGLGKPPARCTLSWSNLSYTVTKGSARHGEQKSILENVTGRCGAGELTAVMGPSGCGKTTLLDILADRISTGSRTGDIELNGAPRNVKAFRAVACYVAQEDSLLGCFTVLETLQMAAHLTLSRRTMTRTAVAELVDRVVVEMGLQVCANTFVGDVFRKGISGGQKRRLSIAIELLSNPSILLLDEPTSGLDSCATYKLMQLLKQLCDQGRTVLCTIHQPSSLVYDMFSNVAILVKGETVYFGPRASMIPHFAASGYACPAYSNPSEFYVGLVNADFEGHGDIPKLLKSYADSTIASDIQNQIQGDRGSLQTSTAISTGSPATVSAVQQLVALLYRNSLKNVRNPGIFGVRLVMYVVLAVCVGTMYLSTNKRLADGDIVVLLFGIHAFFVFNSVAVVPFFIQERAVFLRERGNSGLRVDSFVVANFLAGLPGILLIALLSSVIVVALAGLRSFGLYVLNMFLSLVAAESLMHVIGAVANDGIVGIAIGASLFGMFMLCEGFMVPKASIPDYWVWVNYLGFNSYAFQAFIHTQFLSDATRAVPLAVLRLGMDDISYTHNMLIVVGFTLGFECVFAAILYIIHTGRR